MRSSRDHYSHNHKTFHFCTALKQFAFPRSNSFVEPRATIWHCTHQSIRQFPLRPCSEIQRQINMRDEYLRYKQQDSPACIVYVDITSVIYDLSMSTWHVQAELNVNVHGVLIESTTGLWRQTQGSISPAVGQQTQIKGNLNISQCQLYLFNINQWNMKLSNMSYRQSSKTLLFKS